MSNKLQCLVCIVTLLSLTSCRSLKFFSAEDVVTKNPDQKFELVKNQVIVTTQLEGKDQRLMLDLGASACVIYDIMVINGFYKRKKANFGSAKGAGTGRIKITQLPLSLNDSLFSSRNKVFTVIDNPSMLQKDQCSSGEKIAVKKITNCKGNYFSFSPVFNSNSHLNSFKGFRTIYKFYYII